MRFRVNHKERTWIIAIVLVLAFIEGAFADPVIYTYDASNRLVRAIDTDSEVDYVYDNVGNLLQRLSYKAEATPSPVAFGNINVGSSSAPQTVVISNTGDSTFTIDSVTLSGQDMTSFAVSSNNCTSAALSQSQTCTLQISFAPLAAGSRSAGIDVSLSTPGGMVFSVPLSGTGVSMLNVSINPSSSGSVTAPGINCPGDCSETYSVAGPTAELTAAPNAGYYFTGWTGDVTSSSNPVTFSMDLNRSVTANFAAIPYVRIVRGGSIFYYDTLQAAYNAAVTGDTIQAQAQTFIGNFSVNRDIAVTLQGGYNNTFSSYSGQTSSLKGSLTTSIGGGTLTIRNFILQQ